MSKPMTPKQKVLRRYPKASVSLDSFDHPRVQFNVIASFDPSAAVLGVGATHEEAWADAAKRLGGKR